MITSIQPYLSYPLVDINEKLIPPNNNTPSIYSGVEDKLT